MDCRVNQLGKFTNQRNRKCPKVFTTVSKGYLAGGLSGASAASDESFIYNSEYIWNYELGMKSSWFDNRLTINVADFHMDMADKQVIEVLSISEVKILNRQTKLSLWDSGTYN